MVTSVPVLTVPVSSTGADAIDVTTSDTLPMASATSSVNLSATRTSIFSRTAVLKPSVLTVTVYLPGCKSGKL